MNPKLSVVVPVFQAENHLSATIEEIVSALRSQFEAAEFEILCIDDGSRDQSWSVILQLSQRFPQLKGIRLGRNFGQWPATQCGLQQSTGEFILVLDDDGQHDPHEGLKLISFLRQSDALGVSGVSEDWKRRLLDTFFRAWIGKRHNSSLIAVKRKAVHPRLNLDVHFRWNLSPTQIRHLYVNFRTRRSGRSRYSWIRKGGLVLKSIPNYMGPFEFCYLSLIACLLSLAVGMGERWGFSLFIFASLTGIGMYLSELYLVSQGKEAYWIIEQTESNPERSG